MRYNRSVPPCPVIPVLFYPDPSVAAEWLGKAFGFTVRLRIANHRIQMRAGEGCFTIAEGNIVPNHSILVQVRVEDVLSALRACPTGRRQNPDRAEGSHLWRASVQRGRLLRPQMGLH